MEIYHDKSFKDLTTFKIGGPIENLYYPSTTEELASLLSTEHRFHVIGAGSKILAHDNTYKHVICTKHLNQYRFNKNTLRVAAGVYAPTISAECIERELTGAEFLIDIPATIGGAVIMNAGFMGRDMSQICSSVEYVTFEGEIKETTDIKWARRWCDLRGKGVISMATLNFYHENPDKILERCEEYHRIRVMRQPQGVASAGGVFVNHKVLRDVLQLLPYLKYGDAEIVKDCPNFIINHGNATFDEVIHLINLIEEHASIIGVSMNREIKILENLQ